MNTGPVNPLFEISKIAPLVCGYLGKCRGSDVAAVDLIAAAH
jgi:hypothetical protein